MIVLHATFPIQPDKLDEATELAEELVERSNQEPGMVDYRATTDLTDPHTIRFFEHYEDAQALEAHTRTEYFQAFEERLPALIAGEPEVLQFEVDAVTELDL